MRSWLIETLVATSVLTLLVLLVREPVRRLFGSRVTYALWLILAARLFMPTLTQTVERTVPRHASVQPLAVPLSNAPLWMARAARPDPSVVDRVGGLQTILVVLWLTVATALFLSRMMAFRRDRRAILASSIEVARIGSIRIVRTPEVVGPVALGIVSRLIAVPADFRRSYAPRERRLVLEHELAHHRSGDLVANLFAFVLLCLQWFNPLAWLAHAAFRFDQEAACDARVLDKGIAHDRADYGRAIAKAASGRALLFASALTRRSTLKRRLRSMLHGSNRAQRLAGRLLVAGAIAAALPLTASRAVEYVDIPAPPASAAPIVHDARAAVTAAPTTHAAPVVAAAAIRTPAASRDAPVSEVIPAIAAAAVVQAPRAAEALPEATPVPAVFMQGGDSMAINGDEVTIDGRTKRLDGLTPAEKARVRRSVAEARAGVAKAHIDREQIIRDLAAMADRGRARKLLETTAAAQGSIQATKARLERLEARVAPTQ
jgi:beta-lactamase regulating signal transducer with metallopeptidase domain